MSWRICSAFGVACIALTLMAQTAPPHPKQCVTVKVVVCNTQRQVRVLLSAQGVDLCALVRIEPHHSHRWVDVVWDYAERQPLAMLDMLNPIDATQTGGIDLHALTNTDHTAQARDNAFTGSIGSSMKSLDGANEPIRPKPAGFKMEDLQGGTYEVVTRVYQDTSRRHLCGVARTTVEIR